MPVSSAGPSPFKGTHTPPPRPGLPGITVLTRWVKKPGFLLIPKIIERRTLKRYICTALYSGIFIIAKTWK